MERDRWQHIERLYLSALQVEESRRSRFLEDTCVDETVRREVESLLAYHHQAKEFLEFPALALISDARAPEQPTVSPSCDDDLDLIGKTVSHFRVVERLGGGGMGVVYRAEDLKLGRVVALKFLPESLCIDSDAVTRLQAEARAASALNHPHICTIYEIDEYDGRPFIVMEVLEGETLKTVLTGKLLTIEQVVRLGSEIADALGAAHAKGIAHCDVKPANIFVTQDGHVKLLDFGVARISTAEAIGLCLIDARPFAGTLPYMAPEQVQGKKVDSRTDIYAVGVVLYEMVAGCRPFADAPATKLADQIVHEPPAPPRELNPSVPAALERLILKCLEKNPTNRFQHAQELIAALKQGSTPVRSSARPRAVVLGSALFVIAAVLLTLSLSVPGLRNRWPHRTAPAHIQSIAVLPLENLSHDSEDDYFADGMTEELITDLSKIAALRVISRTSVTQYKETHKTVPEIGRELKVDAVVEGSVARSGHRVRITAQLIQASSDTHLWSQNFERDVKDVLLLQDEVARDIANEIQVNLTLQERTQLANSRPIDAEAHELYLKGRYYWNKRTPDALKKSLEYFQRAVQRDPDYAIGYAGLADAYAMLGASSYMVLPAKQAYPKAEAAALKALQLDSTLAEAHASLAWSKFVFDWDWKGAEREYKQAIDLNPGYANAHHWYARYLSAMGRYSEAIAEDRKAESLDPVSLITIVDVGLEALGPAGRYAEELQQCQKALDMDSNFALAHACLADCYEHQLMHAAAIAEMQRAIELSGGSAPYVALLAIFFARDGNQQQALKVLNELTARSKREFVPPQVFMYIHAQLGDRNEALAYLQKAYDERYDVITGLQTEPLLQPLRSDPRFQNLVRSVNFPQ